MKTPRLSHVVCALALVVWGGVSARAADPVRVAVTPGEDGPRITLTWPESAADAPLTPSADIENAVAVVRLPTSAAFDPLAIRDAAPDLIAMARLDPGGDVLRLALRRDVEPHVSRSYNVTAIDLLAPGSTPPAAVDSPRAARERAAEAEARARADAAAAAAASRAEPPALPLSVRFAETTDYTRIVFDWTREVGFDLAVDGDVATVTFTRDALPDLRRLRAELPRGVTDVQSEHGDGQLQVRVGLQPEYTARAWSTPGETPVTLDIIPAASVASDPAPDPVAIPPETIEPTAPAAADPNTGDAPADPGAREPVSSDPASSDLSSQDPAPAQPPQADPEPDAAPDAPASGPDAAPIRARADRPNPVPADGVVRAEVTPIAGSLHAAFRWTAPVGAAAFRRGAVLWIVFDAPAELDVSELARAGGRQVLSASAFTGDDFAAVRVTAPASTQVEARPDGAAWVFVFGEAVADPPRPIMITREANGAQPGRLVASVTNPSAILSVRDPDAGDRLLVATAYGPPQGLVGARTFVDVAAFSSSHGLAFKTPSDGVSAHIAADAVIVTRDRGLRLTPRRVASTRGATAATVSPGFVDFDAWSVPPADFIDRHAELTRAVAGGEEENEAELELARFLLASELAPEALGVLRTLGARSPRFENDVRFAALSGAANVLTARYDAAEEAFSAPALALDPSSALWRGYIAVNDRNWRDARRQFELGRDALHLFRADWRARFSTAEARAALALNDLAAAKTAIDAALAEDAPLDVQARARLVEAMWLNASGRPDAALETAHAVAAMGYEPVEAAALHLITAIERETGAVSEEEALERLEELRFRWRGDAVEFDIVKELGRVYVEKGEIRRGLTMMRAAARRFPDTSEARETSIAMADIFRELFVHGGADRMDPIQALALWYEFAELTPIGADGDFMIRRLSDRLVEFDLLGQASELLQHQVDERLRGVAKAQVAADLAAVYLMDRRPAEALSAIRGSRLPRLPDTLNAERRLIEARALSELGRHEHGLELLERDRTVDARRLRADIAWASQDWTTAGPLLEAAAGEAWRGPAPLLPLEESFVLRAAIAFSLSGDDDGLDRLRARFNAKMNVGSDAAAWRVATDDAGVDGVTLRDMARRIAAVDTLDAFLDEFRARRLSAAADAT